MDNFLKCSVSTMALYCCNVHSGIGYRRAENTVHEKFIVFNNPIGHASRLEMLLANFSISSHTHRDAPKVS